MYYFFGHCFDNINNTLLNKLFSNTPIQNEFKELKVEHGLISKAYKEIWNGVEIEFNNMKIKYNKMCKLLLI